MVIEWWCLGERWCMKIKGRNVSMSTVIAQNDISLACPAPLYGEEWWNDSEW